MTDVPSSRSRAWIWGLGLVLVLGAAAIWWGPFAAKTPSVVTEILKRSPTSRVLAVNGQVAALTSVEVRSAVSGSLKGGIVSEGDAVTAGTRLASVDASQQEAAVRQAQSALDEGLLVQTQAAKDYVRLRDLSDVATRSALQDAQIALARTGLTVKTLRAQLDQAQIQLDRYSITAPISGTIIQRNVDPGQYIDPSTVLFTLSDLTILVIETNVDEAYATQIAVGQSATMQLVGTTGTIAGKVSFVSPRVDSSTGGLNVKITPLKPSKAPVGLTVTANIVVEEDPNALTVPRTAMTIGPAVFVLRAGKAVKTPVDVIDWPASRVIVTKGLAEGDVLIANAAGITDGQAVKAGN